MRVVVVVVVSLFEGPSPQSWLSVGDGLCVVVCDPQNGLGVGSKVDSSEKSQQRLVERGGATLRSRCRERGRKLPSNQARICAR